MKQFRVILLFNANKVYDRQILKGIGDFLQVTRVNWNIYISDNLRCEVDAAISAHCDGIIANYDDSDIESLVDKSLCPIVGVGASFSHSADYPSIPYIASDNYALIEAAFEHLCHKGIKQFALYSFPKSRRFRWAHEREIAFQAILKKYHYRGDIYNGMETTLANWQDNLTDLANWLNSLPQHTGIIAVNDARARHILQACQSLNKRIPEEYCLIGIDNEEVINYLSSNFISTVTQGTEQMGYKAASLLQRQLAHKPVAVTQILIKPKKIIERRSTDYRSIDDPYVMQGMHFIRNHACSGIKVEQVINMMKISRSNLEARFKQQLGKTMHVMIYEEKLNKAKYLLSHTQLPLQIIAKQCGYPSLQYFYFLFKKEFSLTPKDYREQNAFCWSEISY